MFHLSQFIAQIPFFSPLLAQQTPPLHINHPIAPSLRSSHCPKGPSLSCPSSPPSTDPDTCCINSPSGHFLQTQFWDTSPPIGPSSSWTIHGLWPDLCNGGFDAFCDSSRSHSDIKDVLQRALNSEDDANGGKEMVNQLLDFMSTYWLSYDGNDEHLWAHEWNKHGTCISTLEPNCYPPPTPALSDSKHHHHLDVLDYFLHTTSLFRTLDTYTTLAKADILPSHTTRYTLRDLEDAVSSSPHGQPVTFRCNHRGELDEVWYHFSTMGSLRHSAYVNTTDFVTTNSNSENHDMSPFLSASTVRKHFIPAAPDGILSNCPRRGIKYLSKTPKDGKRPVPAPSRTRTSAGAHPSPTNAAEPFTGRGQLEIHVLSPSSTPTLKSSTDPRVSEKRGCLIRHGEWYASGTCATFHSKRDIVDPGHQPLFSLSSSYSPCLVNPTTNKFECSKTASMQGIFSAAVEDGRVLAYRNRSIFFAEGLPGQFEKIDLFADDDGGRREVQIEIRWVGV